ncbi:dTMP kinase [Sulfoacidibacillus thermotolerans]|uniref:Thymidylate kinase n=1 Tax=Sulfoacidibacillus thermotolerans TaxID=1765684 RepID=A0A2U3D8C5_SULT2|nr:dTMP kinase [Sulfoacidibacillus thermotolerans]PWI57530.1 dTMP kinase [Sulfoacidibacillus thermotolerans]
MNRGVFITFEGIDGSGKTTQVERLCARLRETSHEYICTREPGGTPIGDAIRALLLDPESVMTSLTEAYLYAAARAEHVQRVIAPALAAGKIVICDRFVDASVVYQGYGSAADEVTPELVWALNQPALQGILPHVTFILDVPVEVAEQRLNARSGMGKKDRMEQRNADFFRAVRSGLNQLYEQDQQRMLWLDATGSPETVEQEIWRIVSQLINGGEGSPCN